MGRPKKVQTDVKASEPIPEIPPERLTDVSYYLEQLARISALLGAGRIKPLAAKQSQGFYVEMYNQLTGRDLADAARASMSPIERLSDANLLEMNEGELTELDGAVDALDGLDIEKKNRWRNAIAKAIKIQHRARSSAIAMWIYVGRTSEDNAVFKMAQVHRDFFDVWADDTYPHSLIMAPPAHGKTTCMRGQAIWDVTQNPSIRMLVLYDTNKKAGKEIRVLKKYFRSKRFRALYPHIWVLERKDDAEDSSKMFTVNRQNVGSREPTIEGAAVGSHINGDGYDEIIIDDPCPPQVVREVATREAINFNFTNVVEERFRGSANDRIRMICTPWHKEDLSGMIITDVRSGVRHNWRIEDDKFAIKDDGQGKPISIWADKYDSGYYAQKRRKMHPNDYARLYRMRCVAEEARLVKALRFYPSDMDDPNWSKLSQDQQKDFTKRLQQIARGEKWLSIDPSATSGKTSSETACSELSITADGKFYHIGVNFFPGNPVEMQRWILRRIVGDRIFFQRFIQDDDEDEVQEHKRKLAKQIVPAEGGLHAVLMEAQGGMVGLVSLWEEYIIHQLRAMGITWNGGFHRVKTQGKSQGVQGGQNIGKRQRLKNTSAYLQSGYLRFAGRIEIIPGWQRPRFICSKKPEIEKIVRQILNFPTGATDGVDTVTQFLIYNEDRIADGPDKIAEAEQPQFEGTMARGIRVALTEMRKKPPNEMERENAWLDQKLSVPSNTSSCLLS